MWQTGRLPVLGTAMLAAHQKSLFGGPRDLLRLRFDVRLGVSATSALLQGVMSHLTDDMSDDMTEFAGRMA